MYPPYYSQSKIIEKQNLTPLVINELLLVTNSRLQCFVAVWRATVRVSGL